MWVAYDQLLFITNPAHYNVGWMYKLGCNLAEVFHMLYF